MTSIAKPPHVNKKFLFRDKWFDLLDTAEYELYPAVSSFFIDLSQDIKKTHNTSALSHCLFIKYWLYGTLIIGGVWPSFY